MARSIIGDVVENEGKRKRARLKKKREREQLDLKRIELEREKMEMSRRGSVPQVNRSVQEIMEDDDGSRGHTSLPEGMVGRDPPGRDDVSVPDGPTGRVACRQERSPQPPSYSDPSDPGPSSGGGILALINRCEKEEIPTFLENAIRDGAVVHLPGIDPTKFKFKDYGYRRLVESLIDSEEFLRIIIDIEDIQGVQFVTLSEQIRSRDDPKDGSNDRVISAESTLRGLEGLCEVLYRKEADLDPFENEWKHLNNLLGCFTKPEVNGRKRSWEIRTGKKVLKLQANNTGSELIYTTEIEDI